MNTLKKIYIFIVSIFRKSPVVVRRKRREKHDGEKIGSQYQTIKLLLNDLDTTFTEMKKLRPKRKEMQKIVDRYGPYIVSYEMDDDNDWFPTKKIESHKAYGLPSYFIVWWNTREHPDPNDEYMQTFMVAIKNNKLVYLAKRKGCTYYEVTYIVLYNDKPYEIFYQVEVEEKTGNVRAIPHLTNVVTKLPKGGQYNQHKWHYPNLMDHAVKENPTKEEIKAHMVMSFCASYEITMRREFGVNIIVKKGKNRATFTVAQNRWKYFFKDRIKVKTDNGNTKPIYHAVMSHYRQTKTKIANIKTHYRGTRHFYWNGYEIRIVMQGKHGMSQASFNLEFVQNDPDSKKSKVVDFSGGRTTKMLNDLYETNYTNEIRKTG